MAHKRIVSGTKHLLACLLILAQAFFPIAARADNSRIYLYVSDQKYPPSTPSLNLGSQGTTISFAVKVNYKLYFEDTSPTGELQIIDGENQIFKEICSHYVTNDDHMEEEDRLVRFYCTTVDLRGIFTSKPTIKFTYTSKIEKLFYSLPINASGIKPFYSSPKAQLSLNGTLTATQEIGTSIRGSRVDGSKVKSEMCLLVTCYEVPFENRPIEKDNLQVLVGKIILKLSSEQMKKIKQTQEVTFKSSYDGTPIPDWEGNPIVLANLERELPPPAATKLTSLIDVPISTNLGQRFSAKVRIRGNGLADCSIYLAPSRARGIYSGNGVTSSLYRIQGGTTKAIPLVMGEKFQGTWGAILSCRDAGNGASLKINVATLIQR